MKFRRFFLDLAISVRIACDPGTLPVLDGQCGSFLLPASECRAVPTTAEPAGDPLLFPPWCSVAVGWATYLPLQRTAPAWAAGRGPLFCCAPCCSSGFDSTSVLSCAVGKYWAFLFHSRDPRPLILSHQSSWPLEAGLFLISPLAGSQDLISVTTWVIAGGPGPGS